MTLNAKKGWFAYFMSESVIAQASLAFVSLNRDLDKGERPSAATLQYKAAAIREAHQMLEQGASDATETLAGTVAMLLTMEVGVAVLLWIGSAQTDQRGRAWKLTTTTRLLTCRA